jgi:hypothetical protein
LKPARKGPLKALSRMLRVKRVQLFRKWNFSALETLLTRAALFWLIKILTLDFAAFLSL